MCKKTNENASAHVTERVCAGWWRPRTRALRGRAWRSPPWTALRSTRWPANGSPWHRNKVAWCGLLALQQRAVLYPRACRSMTAISCTSALKLSATPYPDAPRVLVCLGPRAACCVHFGTVHALPNLNMSDTTTRRRPATAQGVCSETYPAHDFGRQSRCLRQQRAATDARRHLVSAALSHIEAGTNRDIHRVYKANSKRHPGQIAITISNSHASTLAFRPSARATASCLAHAVLASHPHRESCICVSRCQHAPPRLRTASAHATA